MQARIKASASAFFPSGRWELLKSLRHVQPVVYRSVIRRCASENQSKCISIFPIGRWEIPFLCGTYTSETLELTGASAAVVQASQSKCVSNFPIGAMGTFEALCGTYRLQLTEASFEVVQARIKANASAVFPLGRWELCKVSAARTACS